MRALRILTWHTHGSYLYYLTQLPHTFYVLSKPGRPSGYAGRSGHIPWGANVHDLPVEQVQAHQFDCIVFQDDDQYFIDQYALLTPEQQALPRIYIEHDAPRPHPTDTCHPVDDPNTLLVHVTPYNALMWDSRRTPTRVIEHGVVVPPDALYTGELDRGLVIINHLARRGRRLGVDVFAAARAECALDLIGMGADELGGLGEVEHALLPLFAGRYRYLFSPVRYASLALAVVEAMMVGLPVVALATTEMATVVRNGVTGYADTNLATLLAYMRMLETDRGHARELGVNARRYASERFGIGRFCADWDAALREVTITRPRRLIGHAPPC